MNSDQVLTHFRETDALLEGHFVLSSGLHSGQYLQCALALQFPSDASRFGKAIAERLLDSATLESSAPASGDDVVVSVTNIETVASPAIGGLVIGYAVAQALNVRFIWTERQDGKMTLRRGFTLKPGERILVVEDVITTGGSTRECIAALEENGGKVVGAASIIDRSNGAADVGVPRISLVSLDVPGYQPDSCPMCAAGTPAVKPGSRSAASN
ncbi:MAG: orotate phosphoribosyltransferase [Acidobacteria bacterium]|nr:orotate phosphoribosyltransferase [Acidobacteriota bacterium]